MLSSAEISRTRALGAVDNLRILLERSASAGSLAAAVVLVTAAVEEYVHIRDTPPQEEP